MKFAISNIAWKPHENEAIYKLIKEHGFAGLEIAPPLFLSGSKAPYDEAREKCLKEKEHVAKHRLELVSMQSLLFGSSGLALFEDKTSRKNLLGYCKKAIDFASLLGIKNLVFGSPKNRIIPEGMSNKFANAIAISFFKELGNYSLEKNTCLAMEANAESYGGNYITKTSQAIELIKEVDCKGFMLNLDMGTMSLEREPIEIIIKALPYTNHIHISEGFLKPIYNGDERIFKERMQIIRNSNYSRYISIEMVAVSDENNLVHVKKALEYVT